MPHLIRKNLFFYFIALIITAYLYRDILQYQYIWDDKIIFVDNYSLLQPKLTWQLLAQPVLEGTTYFRPLVFLSWFWEFKWFGQNPAVSHLINLSFFYFNVLLIYHLILLSFAEQPRRYTAAWLGALVYLCHPMTIEATAWVVGRFDTFVTTFTLLAYVGFLGIKRKWLKNTWVLLCTALALGSKELGILLIFGLYPVWMLRFYQPDISIWQKSKVFFRENRTLLVLGICLIISYLFARVNYASGMVSIPFDSNYIHSYFLKKPLPILAFKQYLIQTLLPFYYLGEFLPIKYFSTPENIFFSVLICTLFGLGIYILWRKRIAVVFPLLNYMLFISLVLYIIPFGIGDTIVAGRLLTLSLAFYSLIIAYCIIHFPTINISKIFTLFLIIYILGLSLVSNQLVPNWRNEDTFWYSMNAYARKYQKFDKSDYFNTLLRREADKEIKEFLARERKINHGSLRPNIQVTYGIYMIFHNNPEGMDALKALIDLLPDSRKEIDFHHTHYPLTKEQLNSLYQGYAYGMLQFKDNPQQAKYYFDISMYHSPKHYTFRGKLILTLILLAQDNLTEAKQVLKIAKKYDYQNKDYIHKFSKSDLQFNLDSLNSLIHKYCKAHPHKITMCQPDFNIYKIYQAL